MLDEIIALFSPRAAYERLAYRQAARAVRDGTRGFDAAARGRRNADWRATNGSPDREILADLPTLRARCRDLVRNNPYAASAVRQLVCNLVGDGIEARAVHADAATAELAQAIWQQFAASRVGGAEDFYGVQKLAVRTMVEGGEALLVWSEVDGVPDARVTVLEGDHLDGASHLWPRDRRINGGVEYDAAGQVANYHVSLEHPGSGYALLARRAEVLPADRVDHLYEVLRPGQSRGVPWLAAGAPMLRELAELDVAIRMKKRIQACLAVFRRPAESTGQPELGQPTDAAAGPPLETLRPGMIAEGRPGEAYDVVNPSSDGDSDVFYRGQLMAVAASLGLPYHLLTGDVSQANYSSLRAATLAFWAALDDWIWNTIVPRLCEPAFRRLMVRESLRRRSPKLAEVRAEWTPPPRSWVDPVKDVTAEIMEIRAGLGSLPQSLSARGVDWRRRLEELRELNTLLDAHGLALDTDARRLNGAGGLQPPAGYLRPAEERPAA